MNKAIFLDRDGTINVDKEYLYKISDFVFLPGVIDGLRILQDNGFLLIIITNQSGIGRGYYSEEDFLKLNRWMVDRLEKEGINITNTYYCPHYKGSMILKYNQECNCRKPALGLFQKAIVDYDIDISSSYVIGDKIRDCSICEISECQGYLVSDNERADIVEDVILGRYRNVYKVRNLSEAVQCIIRNHPRAY